MKWFKHMTGAFRDEKIQALYRKHGMAGIGRFWVLIESVAEQMDESDKCSLSLPDVSWKDRLNFYKTKDVMIFLQCIADLGLISLQCPSDVPAMSGQCVTVLCPNLLKIRDHRIKNRVHKNAPEVEVDSRSIIRTPIVPKRDDKEFQEFWNQYPRKIGRAKVEKIWAKIMRDNMNSKAPIDLAHKIIESVKAQKKTDQLGNPDQKFIPHPATWLNQKRWQDEIEAKRLNGSGSTIDDGEGEWSKIVEHIRRKGISQRIEGISDRTRTALNAIGGMSYLGMARTDQMPFIKKDFKIKYMEVKS